MKTSSTPIFVMVCSVFVMVCSVFCVAMKPKRLTREHCRNLLDAIVAVESGGRLDAVGDRGKAIGPLQIHKIYWIDAVSYDKTLAPPDYKYEDCKKLEYAEKIVVAYWNMWASKNASWEELARVHNGGPKGFTNIKTMPYWIKVKAEMYK